MGRTCGMLDSKGNEWRKDYEVFGLGIASAQHGKSVIRDTGCCSEWDFPPIFRQCILDDAKSLGATVVGNFMRRTVALNIPRAGLLMFELDLGRMLEVDHHRCDSEICNADLYRCTWDAPCSVRQSDLQRAPNDNMG